MRKRNNRIVFYLSDSEKEMLDEKVWKTRLSRNTFLRNACFEIPVKEVPSISSYEVLYQLRKIGINIHQIAIKANSLGLIDAPLYQKNYEDLQKTISKIMGALN